jgi:hypothetical protein
MTRRHGREDGVERKLLQAWLQPELHRAFADLARVLGPDTSSSEFLRQVVRSLVTEGYALAPGVTLRTLGAEVTSVELQAARESARGLPPHLRGRIAVETNTVRTYRGISGVPDAVVGTTVASKKRRRTP